MKTVYSNLHAMRAIVCIAHEWENTVLPYKMTTTLFHLYALLFHNVCTVTCGRPMNAPTDTHILLYIIWSGNTDFHFAIHIPDHNFQLSIFNFQFNKQVWRNWQTRMVQVHVKAISCRFKSCYLHHTAVSYVGTAVLYHIFGLSYGDFQNI